jgi:hypothetical protein
VYTVYLRGYDNAPPSLARLQSNPGSSSRIRSDVYTAGFEYKPLPDLVIGFEYAKSYTGLLNRNLEASLRNFNGYNDAYRVNINYKLSRTKSEFEAIYNKIEPMFFSPGLPFMRSNYENYDLKYRQPFNKGNIVFASSFKYGNDNIYKLSPVTTENLTSTNRLSFKLKKYLNLNFLYSGTRTRVYINQSPEVIRINIYNANAMKMYRGRLVNSTVSLGVNFLDYVSANPARQWNYTAGSSHNFQKHGLFLNHNIIYSTSDVSDSSRFVSYNLSVTKTINAFISIQGAYTLSDIVKGETRHQVSSSLTFSYKNISIVPQANLYLISDKNILRINYLLNLNFLISLNL